MKLGKILLKSKVLSSEVLTKYLMQTSQPPWTSYFIKLKDCENDLKGSTSFNWKIPTGENYHILRTWCWPYLKFHCTKTDPPQDLKMENKFFEIMKKINLGIPLVAYGVAAIFLIRHEEIVNISDTTKIKIYFLIPEDKGSSY